jgi:hypothetical protein
MTQADVMGKRSQPIGTEGWEKTEDPKPEPDPGHGHAVVPAPTGHAV